MKKIHYTTTKHVIIKESKNFGTLYLALAYKDENEFNVLLWTKNPSDCIFSEDLVIDKVSILRTENDCKETAVSVEVNSYAD